MIDFPVRNIRRDFVSNIWILRCHVKLSASSFTLLFKYLAIESGGYLSMNGVLRINFSMAEYFTEKSRWCLIEQVCLGVKWKAFWWVQSAGCHTMYIRILILYTVPWLNIV